MGSKVCCNCGQHIDKRDMVCANCNSEQLRISGMFGWSFLGFIGGFVIPFVAGLLITLLINDKHVAEHFLDVTITGRRRWYAARKGMIVGLITKMLCCILLIGGCVYILYWFANGVYG